MPSIAPGSAGSDRMLSFVNVPVRDACQNEDNGHFGEDLLHFFYLTCLVSEQRISLVLLMKKSVQFF